MQWLAALCVKRPVFAWVLVLSLTVVGLFAFGRLGVDRFPNVDIPTISVTTRLPASFLQLHPRVELYLDRAAASRLRPT